MESTDLYKLRQLRFIHDWREQTYINQDSLGLYMNGEKRPTQTKTALVYT